MAPYLADRLPQAPGAVQRFPQPNLAAPVGPIHRPAIQLVPVPRSGEPAPVQPLTVSHLNAQQRRALNKDLKNFGKFLRKNAWEWRISREDMLLVRRYARDLADPQKRQRLVAEINCASATHPHLRGALDSVFTAIDRLPHQGLGSLDNRRAIVRAPYMKSRLKDALAGEAAGFQSPAAINRLTADYKSHLHSWRKKAAAAALIGIALLTTAGLCASGLFMPVVVGTWACVGIAVVTGIIGMRVKEKLDDYAEWHQIRGENLKLAVMRMESESIEAERRAGAAMRALLPPAAGPQVAVQPIPWAIPVGVLPDRHMVEPSAPPENLIVFNDLDEQPVGPDGS